METRELFWSLDRTKIWIFYAFGYTAIAIFLFGCWRMVAKYANGVRHPAGVDPWTGLVSMVREVFSHRGLKRRDRITGLMHKAVFIGFLFAAIGTTIIFIDADIIRPIFGVSIWKGKFYLITSFLMDVGHLGLMVGLGYLIWRRAFQRPAKLDYARTYRGEDQDRPVATKWRIEDWLFLSLLLVIEITGFLQEGVRYVMSPVHEGFWSPVGFALAKLFVVLGMTDQIAAQIRSANWWFHGILALAFTASIPWYKAKHILTVLISLGTRDRLALRRLPAEAEDRGHSGYRDMSDFSWKDMANLDACTKCGRCHEACPAQTTGYPLSPRDLVLDLREHNDKVRGACEGRSIVDLVVDAETLWSCRSCGACQEICPVGIEHPTMIVQMRRNMVENGNIDPLLQKTLDDVARTGNSFGQNGRERPAWTKELEFTIKDAREEPVEYLWFVGDFASLDPRNQKVSQTVARLLKAASIDFGLLYEAERTAGNDIRRVGEEGLFDTLARHNIEQLQACKPFRKILTTDPHSYNTLKNEYPELGATYEVLHYSELLETALSSGALVVKKPLDVTLTYHDPCHLGRLNGVYDAPRNVLARIGCTLIEMPRNRDNSFCCGAGGGRIWMPDPPGKEKPSQNRMLEAVGLPGVETFVTCCPKDLTMFEDARKTSGSEEKITVQDIAELVAEAIELKQLRLEDVPDLIARIVDMSALRVEAVTREYLGKLTIAAPAHPVLPAPALPEPIASTAPEARAGDPPDRPSPDVAEPRALDPAPAPVPVPDPDPVADESAARAVSLQPMDWDNLAPRAATPFPDHAPPAKTAFRIVVAVKAVATLAGEFQFDRSGRHVDPQYLDYELNELDDVALEIALRIIEAQGGGEVVVATVAPDTAEPTLRKALAKGAHRAVRIWSDELVDADSMIVAQSLAGIARAEDADLVLTGVQSADMANGSTGPAIAGILDLPCAVSVQTAEVLPSGGVRVVRELEGGVTQALEMALPAVLCAQSSGTQPRYATMRMMKQAQKKPLDVVSGELQPLDTAGSVLFANTKPTVTKAKPIEGSATEVAAFVADLIRKSR